MENQSAPKNEISETSKPQDLKIRKWIFVLAKLFQYDLPLASEIGGTWIPSLADTWVLALRDIEPQQLESGFQKLMKTWRPEYGKKFPVPGDILALLSVEQNMRLASEAEDSWQKLLHLIDEAYHPDLGWRAGASAIYQSHPRMKHACEAAGGIEHIWMATLTDRQWAKKRFVEDYLREEKLDEALAPLPPPTVPALKAG